MQKKGDVDNAQVLASLTKIYMHNLQVSIEKTDSKIENQKDRQFAENEHVTKPWNVMIWSRRSNRNAITSTIDGIM